MTQRITATRSLSAAILAMATTLCVAQTHKVAKPENVVRAVGVYEWTGDMAKPNAMRLIPITIYIDNHLQDAGVYLARPVPFALSAGNVYEVQQAGVPKGTIELFFTRHFMPTDVATTSPFDDGWFGYGRFLPPAPPKKSTLRASKTIPVIDSGDDSRPHFSSRSAAPGSGGAAAGVPGASSTSDAPPDDPDRPTLHKSSSSQGRGEADQSASTPPADPDRPTLHKSSGDTNSQTASNSVPDDPTIDDPDRPTLRHRSSDQAAKAKADQSHITDVPSLNDDPNRPTLHRGRPAGAPNPEDFHQLSGLPPEQDLHQMVAVSDAASRPVHDFARAWDDESEHQAILSKMQSAAQAQLAAYLTANHLLPSQPPAAPTAHSAARVRRTAAAPAKPAAPPAQKLVDEQLKGYTLSYGAHPTYVYTAHTDGSGAPVQYVTLVAEVDMEGVPQFALKSVTDAAHLDRSPRMRLVDAVDAESSNRASLLFELREEHARQFALYRVIGAHADQTFLTGTTE